jgi:hypothetical protein
MFTIHKRSTTKMIHLHMKYAMFFFFPVSCLKRRIYKSQIRADLLLCIFFYFDQHMKHFQKVGIVLFYFPLYDEI